MSRIFAKVRPEFGQLIISLINYVILSGAKNLIIIAERRFSTLFKI